MVMISDCVIGSSDPDPARHGPQKGRIEVLHAGLIKEIRHFQIKMFFQLKNFFTFWSEKFRPWIRKNHWHGGNKKFWIWIQHKP
jgi:hypothetical protein